jgi:hypothetical protein
MHVDNPDHPWTSWPIDYGNFSETAETVKDAIENTAEFDEIEVERDSNDAPTVIKFHDIMTGKWARITIEETS